MDYKFPDELDNDPIELEVIDDTPPADRNIEPLPKQLVDDLENLDGNEEYSKNVKNKFLQFKKVYHDERRAKEAAQREQEEAISIAQQILDENKRLKQLLKTGEEELLNTYKSSAELELEKAKRNYKAAYDNGSTDEVIEAQQEVIKASQKLDKANNFQPTISTDETIQLPVKQPQIVADPKVTQWVADNPWYIDPAKKPMARYALAVHEDLLETHGQKYIGSDAYYKAINKEVQRRFPEEFEIDAGAPTPTAAPLVVASVKRSTSSRKITLNATQLALSKKLGLTPEQYAAEVVKLETQHG